MKEIVLCILLTIASVDSNSCDSPNWDHEEWLERADVIFYGKVISLAVAKESSNFDELFEDASPSTIDRDVRFRVLSQLKGNETESREIEAYLSWCGGGEVEFLKDAIFIKKNGYWISFSKKQDIEWFLRAATNKK